MVLPQATISMALWSYNVSNYSPNHVVAFGSSRLQLCIIGSSQESKLCAVTLYWQASACCLPRPCSQQRELTEVTLPLPAIPYATAKCGLEMLRHILQCQAILYRY